MKRESIFRLNVSVRAPVDAFQRKVHEELRDTDVKKEYGDPKP